MGRSILLGEGEMYGKPAEPGAPGSPNYGFWLEAAQEVGLNVDDSKVDISAVEAARSRLVDETGMAPPGDKIWTWEHARAARLVTAFRQNVPDMTNLDPFANRVLISAIRATWVHVDGVVSAEEAANLANLTPLIDAYTEGLVGLADGQATS